MAIGTPNSTIKTRIQLKSDTESNWRKAVLSSDHPQGQKTSGTSFIPLRGEIIIFEPDDTYDYSRLKIGTGKLTDNVLALPFIDSGTLNGIQVEIVKCSTRDYFPEVGSKDKLYIDLEKNKLYHYIAGRGYSELLNISFSITTTTAATIGEWTSGAAATAVIQNHKCVFTNGVAPRLVYSNQQVVQSITQGE